MRECKNKLLNKAIRRVYVEVAGLEKYRDLLRDQLREKLGSDELNIFEEILWREKEA